jgi:hypothetical protein
MSLFGRNPEKQAQTEAGEAEVARLMALPLPELAAEILPGFGVDGAKRLASATGINLGQLMIWKMEAFPRATGFMETLATPVREATQLLEHANLVERRTFGKNTHINATTLGEEAIAAGTAMKYLTESRAARA